MDVGSQHAEEWSGDGLASCLAVCLLDIEESQPRSASLLRFAMLRLRRSSVEVAPYKMNDVARAGAIEPFLLFLLPEIEAKSAQAARAVRSALRLLRGPRPARRAAVGRVLN